MKVKMTPAEAGKLGSEAAKETVARLKQERIDNYNKNPKECKFCKKVIPYDKRQNDYCSQSCSAKLVNLSKGYTLSENKINICLNCSKQFKAEGTAEHKYCSRQCMIDHHWTVTKNKILSDGYDTSSNHRTARKLLIELNQGTCQICNLSEWMGKPMPLVLDHISGNSEDGSLSNLRVICNNCDAQTDTYKSKNNGNGRARRRKRYQEGKSY